MFFSSGFLSDSLCIEDQILLHICEFETFMRVMWPQLLHVFLRMPACIGRHFGTDSRKQTFDPSHFPHWCKCFARQNMTIEKFETHISYASCTTCFETAVFFWFLYRDTEHDKFWETQFVHTMYHVLWRVLGEISIFLFFTCSLLGA
jgi:hypothetical protein